MWTGLKR